MSDIISKIRERAKATRKRIVLPEYDDQRVKQAAQIIEKEGIAKICLLTPENIDKEKQKRYTEDFFSLRKAKGDSLEDSRKALSSLLYYAAMMVREAQADGFVAGASHSTSEVARAAIHCLGIDEQMGIASSCFVMIVPNCSYGEEGVFVFADCGIIPQPSPEQLAYIAIEAAQFTEKVLAIEPRVAFLSYSTKNSASGWEIDRIKEALNIACSIRPQLLIDGELQVDAAIIPEFARIKQADKVLAGRANVLIFPDLEAGNIGYKLVQRLARARALGPLLLGLKRPCSDLSRSCSVEDIVDCVAVTAIRAQK